MAYAPSPALRSIASCFWFLPRARAALTRTARILPDGAVDLVVSFSLAGAEAWVSGVASGPRIAQRSLDAGRLGISFAPGEASAPGGGSRPLEARLSVGLEKGANRVWTQHRSGEGELEARRRNSSFKAPILAALSCAGRFASFSNA